MEFSFFFELSFGAFSLAFSGNRPSVRAYMGEEEEEEEDTGRRKNITFTFLLWAPERNKINVKQKKDVVVLF